MANFTLQLLHHADFEAGAPAIDSAPRFAALLDAADDTYVGNTLKLSGGDNWLAGPWANAQKEDGPQAEVVRAAMQAAYEEHLGLESGTLSQLQLDEFQVDQAFVNLMGFQASAVGNHEFDSNASASLLSAINPAIAEGAEATWENVTTMGSFFPYITANLDFSEDEDLADVFTDTVTNVGAFGLDEAGAEATDLSDYLVDGGASLIAPGTVVEVGGESIGIIGATTQRLNTITPEKEVVPIGSTVDDMTLLASQLQTQIDAMTGQGIDKIIVVSHLQEIGNEKSLASKLSGADIILGGGSNAIFADSNDVIRDGDLVVDDYPLSITGADGNEVLLVNTKGQYEYLGRLVVEFDENGQIIPESIDPNESGSFATTEAAITELYGDADPYAEGTMAGRIKSIAEGIDGIIGEKAEVIAGYTDVYLQGERAYHRNQESNLGNLLSDAMLSQAEAYVDTNPDAVQDADYMVAIKNSGSIRAPIGSPVGISGAAPEGGVVSQLDIETTLAFGGSTAIVPTTALGLVRFLENGLSTAGQTDGRFPQIAGMKIAYNPNAEADSRLEEISIIDESGTVTATLMQYGALVVDETTPVNVVMSGFVAGGGDGYPVEANLVEGQQVVELGTGEETYGADGYLRTAVADYLAENHGTPGSAFAAAETPIGQDSRIVVTEDRLSDFYEEDTIAIDLDGQTGQIMKIISAVFGAKEATDDVKLGIGLYYVDQGFSDAEIVDLALNELSAGRVTDPSIAANLVYQNIYGEAPEAGWLSGFDALVDSGVEKEQLILAMANSESNVELIGLNEIDYVAYTPFSPAG